MDSSFSQQISTSKTASENTDDEILISGKDKLWKDDWSTDYELSDETEFEKAQCFEQQWQQHEEVESKGLRNDIS